MKFLVRIAIAALAMAASAGLAVQPAYAAPAASMASAVRVAPAASAAAPSPQDVCPTQFYKMCLFVDANYGGPGLLWPWNSAPTWSDLSNVNGQNWSRRISSIVNNDFFGYCFYQSPNFVPGAYIVPRRKDLPKLTISGFNDTFASFARMDKTDSTCHYHG
jgi:hypothetical protein